MDEPIEELVSEPVPEPKTNRGHFRPGDHRINREGRPRGRKAAAPDGPPPLDCAKRPDRVMRLFVPERMVARRLVGFKAGWVANLPDDFRFVDCRFDTERDGFVITVRSDMFPRVARGAAIPEFGAEFLGMMWNRAQIRSGEE